MGRAWALGVGVLALVSPGASRAQQKQNPEKPDRNATFECFGTSQKAHMLAAQMLAPDLIALIQQMAASNCTWDPNVSEASF